MPSFEDLLKDKTKRLADIPANLLTIAEKQQKRVLTDIISLLGELTIKNGAYEITKENIKTIAKISDELKSVFLTPEYLKGVKSFANEFEKQAVLNQSIIKAGFGSTESPIAADAYITLAKRSVIEALIGSPIDKEFIKPIQSILETAVINGSSTNDLITNITNFVEGNKDVDAKILRYVKQISNDSFAIADRSYTSIVADALDNDWFYYSGSEVESTRCFCKSRPGDSQTRYGNFYHYLEIESWGRGENLGKCDLGDGTWAGMIAGTNESTIYSNLGGWKCGHYLMPVSDSIVPESDFKRARDLGFID